MKTLVCSIVLFMCAISLVKNLNTFENHRVIHNAIHCYCKDLIKNREYNFEIDYYEMMESYPKTFFRFWDWSHKNIVSKENYALLERYILK